jgi:hypothetical protein
LGIFGVFGNISVIISLHFKEEDFAFTIGAALDDVVINQVQNVLAIEIKFCFDGFFVVLDNLDVLGTILLFFLSFD